LMKYEIISYFSASKVLIYFIPQQLMKYEMISYFLCAERS
jgi:hypothetical protein